MEVYLVGGAVRDQLLNLPVKDRDWVVVGASVQEMLDLGYRQVGKDFPVFLHPDTQEEYALARKERKTAAGYHGFEFETSNQVSLEEDLQRRDLTINAMARDSSENLIDPFGGEADVNNRVLRHVSDAFAEDPVRVLRIARFAARYARLGFSVHPSTMELMQSMVASGELDALVAERVWQELRGALGERTPSAFIQTLRSCGALDRVLPEVAALYGVPQPEQHHPEVDTGVHVEMVLDKAAEIATNFYGMPDSLMGFAALTHDLGKATTPVDELPQHIAHEHRGLKPLEKLCQRLRVPNQYKKLAQFVCRYHLHSHRALSLRPTKVLDVLLAGNCLRQQPMLERFVMCCQADAQGRAGLEDRPYPQADFFLEAAAVAAAVDIQPLLDQGLEGAKLGQRIRQLRVDAIRAMRQDFIARHPPDS